LLADMLTMPLGPRLYSQEEIDGLIARSKVVSDPPKRDWKADRGHLRNDLRLKSAGGLHEFRVFLRRNEDLPDNSSIGLVYLPKDGSGELTLLRCNGPHGGFNDSFDPAHPHWSYHVHRARAEMIEAGHRPEKSASPNQAFASCEAALHFFSKAANITDAVSHFAGGFQAAFDFPAQEPPA
jgi:hypothetical protein